MTIHMPMPARPGASAVASAYVVALSERRSAIFFDSTADDLPRGARISAQRDGQPFDGPLAVTRLDRACGGVRHVMLVAYPARELCASSVGFEASGATVARIDPLALQSPLVDPLAVIAGLGEPGGRRLLKLMLTTGASLFGKGELGGFGMIVGRLIEALTSPVPLSAWCPVGGGAGILSWRLATGASLSELRDLCILHDGRARRYTDFTPIEETAGGERILHILISRPLPEGADLVVLGEAPARLAGPDARAIRPLSGWLERRGPQVRARTLDWLDRMAAGDARMAELRDELASPSTMSPKIGVLHLSETSAGLLYLLSVDDPCGLLSALRLSVAGHSVDISCTTLEWHSNSGAVVAGFAPITGRSGGTAEITPVYRSGRAGTIVRAQPVPFDGRVPTAFAGLPRSVAAEVLAQAIPPAMRGRPVWRRRTVQFGPQPQSPRTALIVDACGATEHLHATLAELIAERGGRKVEVILHHPDGPQSDTVRATAESLSAIHRVGVRVVSAPSEAFPSERLRAALAETRAPSVLVLGALCLPETTGWLAAWRRRIGTDIRPRAVVAEVASWDGSVRHSDETLGLNAAAVRRLLQTRPLLPGAGADIAATPGLARVKGPSVTAYQPDTPESLTRMAEQVCIRRNLETGHA